MATLNDEIVRFRRLPHLGPRLVSQAADPAANEPEAFAGHIAAGTRQGAQAIRQAGIRPE